MPVVPYPDALARVRGVLTCYAARPEFLPGSLELEDAARAVARAALRDQVPLAAAVADLGRLAAVTVAADQNAAVKAARAMSRWAAREYEEVMGAAP